MRTSNGTPAGSLSGAEAPAGCEAAYLPTPSHENHASFVTRLRDGTTACVWFAGSAEGRPDVDILMSTLSAGGDAWSDARTVASIPDRSDQNPVLFESSAGEIVLLHTSQELGAQDTAEVLLWRSADRGETWSGPETLPGGPGLFIRQGLIERADGSWVLPAFRCPALPGRQWHGSGDYSIVLSSEDRGRHWEESVVPDSLGLVHMAMLPRQGDRWVAFFRSRWADNVYRALSEDGGRTWSAPTATPVPNNNSSIGVASAGAGAPILLVGNTIAAAEGASDGDDNEPDEPGKRYAPGQREPLDRHAVWGTPRLPLAVLRSDDDGLTWREVLTLEDGESLQAAGVDVTAYGERGPEMSYPSIAVDDDGTAHITYSYLRDAVKYVRAPADRL